MWRIMFQNTVKDVINRIYETLDFGEYDDSVLMKLESDLIYLIDLVNRVCGKNLNYHRIRPLRVDVKNYQYHLFDCNEEAIDDFLRFVAGVKFLMEVYRSKKGGSNE